MTKRLISSLTVLLALIGMATIAFGAAASAGVVYACVNDSSGTVKVVGPTDACPTNWTALSWNQQGPKGDSGAPGATGPTGPAGAPGPSGAATVTYNYRFGGMVTGTSIARALCLPGEMVTGGGGFATDPSQAGLTQNHPISTLDGVVAWGTTAIGWQVASENFGTVQAYVICVR